MSSDLWSFSVSFYQQPGTDVALLTLQDEGSMDVPCLLLCLWLAERRITFSNRVCRSCVELAAIWSAEAISPVRQARRWLKNQDRQDIYRELKDAELNLERALLEKLEIQCQHLASDDQTTISCAKKNTRLYLQQAGIDLDSSGQKLLNDVIGRLA